MTRQSTLIGTTGDTPLTCATFQAPTAVWYAHVDLNAFFAGSAWVQRRSP